VDPVSLGAVALVMSGAVWARQSGRRRRERQALHAALKSNDIDVES